MQAAMSSRLTVLLLALMLGIQPVSSDLYLPTLPILTQEFGASMAQAHMTLSALLLALDRKSTRLNSSHIPLSRMPSSA